jgi:spore protease
LLEPLGDRLIVTPKEIDQFIEDMATVIAMGLNLALHPVMSLEDARVLLH